MAPSPQFQRTVRLLIKLIQVWLPNRRNSIKIMREKGDELEKITKTSTFAKLALTVGGVAGGLLATTAAAPVTIGLGVAVALGIGKGGTEVMKLYVSKEPIKNAQEVLERDRSELEEITKQANILSNLMSNTPIQEVDTERLRELIDDAIYNGQTSCTTVPEGERRDDLSISQLFRIFSVSDWLPSIFRSVGKEPQSYTKLYSMCKDVFQNCTMTLNPSKFFSFSFSPFSSPTAQNVAGKISKACPVVFLAIDIYQLVLTSIEIHKGPKSEVGTCFREIAVALEKEMRVYERLLQGLDRSLQAVDGGKRWTPWLILFVVVVVVVIFIFHF